MLNVFILAFVLSSEFDARFCAPTVPTSIKYSSCSRSSSAARVFLFILLIPCSLGFLDSISPTESIVLLKGVIALIVRFI